MIRRFNYTGRVKILRSRVSISLHSDRNGKYFSARIDLNGLSFPSDAKIFIEPNFKGVYQRFYFGTISQFKAPDKTYLNELPETELAYFDISVVDETGSIGLLLGTAKGIAISTNETPNDRIPLLPVNPADLGNQFWKISFDSGDDGRPVLEINKNIPEVFEMARNDIRFISLVYPAAFRQVLNKLLQQGDLDAEEDSWISQWLRFINQVLHVKSVPDLDNNSDEFTSEQEGWIDECVNEYCKKLQLFEKFVAQ